MAKMQTIQCQHDGEKLQGWIARPVDSPSLGAILVIPNANGLGEHIIETTGRLADEGYIALVADMHGGGAYFDDPDAAIQSLMPLLKDPEKLRARTLLWFEQLKLQQGVESDHIAAIGYCFGGQCVLELAREGVDVRLAVSYHGTLRTHRPAPPGTIKAYVAVFTGDEDPFIPRETVSAFQEEMRAADARWNVSVFGKVQHSFTDPNAITIKKPGNVYDALADELSWAGTIALLKATI